MGITLKAGAMSNAEFEHVSVMLGETIDSLCIDPNGADRTYFDCTGGKGGHSAELLGRLNKTDQLVILDRDPDAVKVLSFRFGDDERVKIFKRDFAHINDVASELGIDGADGIIADLGVSSFQLDNAERGFSYMQDAPLDMRMSKEGLSAANIVNEYDEKAIAEIIFRFGEEKMSRQIARAIVNYRKEKEIESTLELAEIVKSAFPVSMRRKSRHHVAKKTFQAIRIAVNDELGQVEAFLNAGFELLKVGGRMSVITFHSLEDRLVKRSFAARTVGCICPKEFPVCVCGQTPEGKTEKFKKPSDTETERNPRARSATLRTITKLK